MKIGFQKPLEQIHIYPVKIFRHRIFAIQSTAEFLYDTLYPDYIIMSLLDIFLLYTHDRNITELDSSIIEHKRKLRR